MNAFFQKVSLSLEIYREKENISDNLVRSIFELHKVLVQVPLTTSKKRLRTEYNKLGI